MKKVTLKDSLTPKPHAVPAPAAESAAASKPPRLTDLRRPTSVRIEPEKMERLKVIAYRRRIRVNELILEGIDHVLALYGERDAA
jgi:hypothetical protein